MHEIGREILYAFSQVKSKKYYAEVIGTFAVVFCRHWSQYIINQETAGVVTHLGHCIYIWTCCDGDDLCSRSNIRSTFQSGSYDCFHCCKKISGKGSFSFYLESGCRSISPQVFYFDFVVDPENELLGSTIPAGSSQQSFILELLLTFFLMLIINVATGSKEQGMFAGLAIGSTVLLEAMFAVTNLRSIDESYSVTCSCYCFRTYRTSLDLFISSIQLEPSLR